MNQKNNKAINKELKKYKFYHKIKVKDDIFTKGDEGLIKFQKIPLEVLKKYNLKNKKVLDIGCRDGLFSFESEKLGAKEILGIDNDLSIGATKFLIPYFKSKVKMKKMNLYDLDKNKKKYDLIIFFGVLYHLRYPIWALKIIKESLNTNGILLIETAVYILGDKKVPILYCPFDNNNPYDKTSCTFFNEVGLVQTLSSLNLEVKNITYSVGPKNLLKKVFLKKPYPIRRATFECVLKNNSKNNLLNSYWNKYHQNHTINNKFKK